MKKKFKFVLALAAISAGCLLGGANTLETPVTAEDVTLDYTMEMVNGASIKIDPELQEEKSGIRFSATMLADNYIALESYDAANENVTVDYGMLIATYNSTKKVGALNTENVFGADSKYYIAGQTAVVGKAKVVNMTTGNLGYYDETHYALHGSLVNMGNNATVLSGEFIARAYVAVTVDGVTEYYDAQYVNGDPMTNVRSMAYIAQRTIEASAMDSGKLEFLENSYVAPITEAGITAEYTVQHNKILSDGTKLTETSVGSGVIGATVTVEAKEYLGFTLANPEDCNYVVLANGKGVLNLNYYENETDGDVIWSAGTSSLNTIKGTTGAQLSIIENEDFGYVIKANAEGGRYPKLTITTSTANNLPTAKMISYWIKVNTAEGYENGLTVLPTVHGATPNRGDEYTSSEQVFGTQINAAMGWKKVTLFVDGLNTAYEKDGVVKQGICENGDGTYNVALQWISRFDSETNIDSEILLAQFTIEEVTTEETTVIWSSETAGKNLLKVDYAEISYVTDSDRGEVIKVNAEAGRYPKLTVETITAIELPTAKAICYWIKVNTTDATSDGLTVLPTVLGVESDRGDEYVGSEQVFGTRLTSAMGWQKVVLFVDGLNTSYNSENVGISYNEETGKYDVVMKWISRMGENKLQNNVATEILLDDIEIVPYDDAEASIWNGWKDKDETASVTVSAATYKTVCDEQKGYVLQVNAEASKYPKLTIKTDQDLSNAKSISYWIKLNTSEGYENGLTVIPTVLGAKPLSNRGDKYIASEQVFGKRLNADMGWQKVVLYVDGLNTAYGEEIGISANGDGTYNVTMQWISRVDVSTGLATEILLADFRVENYEENVDLIYDIASADHGVSLVYRSSLSSAWTEDKGYVLKVNSEENAYPKLTISTTTDLSKAKKISFWVKLNTESGYVDGLTVLPSILGATDANGKYSSRGDQYYSSEQLLGKKLNAQDGWVQLTFTVNGLNTVWTNAGGTTYSGINYNETTGKYELVLQWISRVDTNTSLATEILLANFVVTEYAEVI